MTNEEIKQKIFEWAEKNAVNITRPDPESLHGSVLSSDYIKISDLYQFLANL